MVLSLRVAQVWEYAAVTRVALLIPVTGTGVVESALVPLPSCPKPLDPQQAMVLSLRVAQVWDHPPLTLVALVMPVTGTGVLELALV